MLVGNNISSISCLSDRCASPPVASSSRRRLTRPVQRAPGTFTGTPIRRRSASRWPSPAPPRRCVSALVPAIRRSSRRSAGSGIVHCRHGDLPVRPARPRREPLAVDLLRRRSCRRSDLCRRREDRPAHHRFVSGHRGHRITPSREVYGISRTSGAARIIVLPRQR